MTNLKLKLDDKIIHIPPQDILVGERQRKEVGLTDGLIDSIKTHGILSPLIVRNDFNLDRDTPIAGKPYSKLFLIAGRRRLACAIELKLKTVPAIFYDAIDLAEAKVIELEENIKRESLPVRDHVEAVRELHDLKLAADPAWTIKKTGALLGLSESQTSKILAVSTMLDTNPLSEIKTLTHAIGIVQRLTERKQQASVTELLHIPSSTSVEEIPIGALTKATMDKALENFSTIYKPGNRPITMIKYEDNFIPTKPIFCTDFDAWAKDYSGPKFSAMQLDFGKDHFTDLIHVFYVHYNKFLSTDARILCWLDYYMFEAMREQFISMGFLVPRRPLVWLKSDTRQPPSGTQGEVPKSSYETALLAYRGYTNLVYTNTDSYTSQTVPSPICVGQKPEAMLRHFLSMIIDHQTDFLDPACGSGAALRAAEDLGARSVLGIERDPNIAEKANQLTLEARALRNANKELGRSEPR